MKTTQTLGPFQQVILNRIKKKGFILANDHKTNVSVNALEKKKLVKCSVHTTPSGQKLRKVELTQKPVK